MSKNNTVEGTKDNKKSASKKSTAKKAEAKKTSKKSDSKKSAAKSTTEKKSGFNIKQLGGALFAKMMRGGASELRANAEEVNRLNVFPVPDGDTGDNMRMTIESGIAALENSTSNDIAEVMKVVSKGMLLGARGNSGVILSQFFAGVAKGFDDVKKADAKTIGKALEAGVAQAYTSVMTPTEGTILTVARESVEYAVSRINDKSTIRSLFADLVKEMHNSLERTPEKLAQLKEAGVVDSGGAGLFYIMDGINRVLNGEEIDEGTPTETASKLSPAMTGSFGPDSEMTYGYCTELLIQLMNRKCDVEAFDIEPLKAFLASIGDSVVCFKTDSIVKLHVHTLTPEKVLEHCRSFGEFITIKIENMSVQHTSSEEPAPAPVATAPVEKKRYAVVAVSNGPGIEELFRELGTDEIVQGGQTNNPSTNDFIEAFGRISAEHIFVLPNNGNIVMAANQAAEIYTEAKVHVIPAKNIGAGYVALSSMNLDSDNVEEIVSDAEEAISRITSAYVSPAVRDADMNGVHVTEGDTIGIVGKEIIVSKPSRMSATRELISYLIDGKERYMLTVFVGADPTPEEQAMLENHVAEAYPELEVYFISGGQEIYPYIFVAE